jgi:hypothetical protein
VSPAKSSLEGGCGWREGFGPMKECGQGLVTHYLETHFPVFKMIFKERLPALVHYSFTLSSKVIKLLIKVLKNI